MSEGKLRDRSIFEVRTWESERWLSSTPQWPTGNGHAFGDPNPAAGVIPFGPGPSVCAEGLRAASEGRLAEL